MKNDDGYTGVCRVDLHGSALVREGFAFLSPWKPYSFPDMVYEVKTRLMHVSLGLVRQGRTSVRTGHLTSQAMLTSLRGQERRRKRGCNKRKTMKRLENIEKEMQMRQDRARNEESEIQKGGGWTTAGRRRHKIIAKIAKMQQNLLHDVFDFRVIQILSSMVALAVLAAPPWCNAPDL